jgi:hypothetical protein
MLRELEWPDEPGVYFVQAGDESRVKIGKANNVRARLTQLQSEANRLAVNFRLKLLCVVQGGLREERSLHKKFASLRVNRRNEWFWLRDELLEFLTKLVMARKTFDLVLHVESIIISMSDEHNVAIINAVRLKNWTEAYITFAELGCANFSGQS